ncbi:hypothetical protein EIN_371430 [Entamoeba invadens IP1]|uniref:Uncharacterized protein n=1 Tax=Entamoeba invadens IP1 TaxID=370355 RepID=A0A0A1UBY8_ENTIV|nr:hypothetical protein EIN_371430 [Entamoeba invadens IP1]ELP92731.1 hypothetical protein EIN_371430 [Entamoeba invadens IP1]|eukprot:XP_004259502.1 hypothetical protein EIN_371430 [Entamoeba invadens IP1]
MKSASQDPQTSFDSPVKTRRIREKIESMDDIFVRMYLISKLIQSNFIVEITSGRRCGGVCNIEITTIYKKSQDKNSQSITTYYAYDLTLNIEDRMNAMDKRLFEILKENGYDVETSFENNKRNVTGVLFMKNGKKLITRRPMTITRGKQWYESMQQKIEAAYLRSLRLEKSS